MDVPRGDVKDILKARIEHLYEQWLMEAGDILWREGKADNAIACVQDGQERRWKSLQAIEGMEL